MPSVAPHIAHCKICNNVLRGLLTTCGMALVCTLPFTVELKLTNWYVKTAHWDALARLEAVSSRMNTIRAMPAHKHTAELR
jgi:hypothetical protein